MLLDKHQVWMYLLFKDVQTRKKEIEEKKKKTKRTNIYNPSKKPHHNSKEDHAFKKRLHD